MTYLIGTVFGLTIAWVYHNYQEWKKTQVRNQIAGTIMLFALRQQQTGKANLDIKDPQIEYLRSRLEKSFKD